MEKTRFLNHIRCSKNMSLLKIENHSPLLQDASEIRKNDRVDITSLIFLIKCYIIHFEIKIFKITRDNAILHSSRSPFTLLVISAVMFMGKSQTLQVALIL